jgi:hypothetical protein
MAKETEKEVSTAVIPNMEEEIVTRSIISTDAKTKIAQVVLSYKTFNIVRKLRNGIKENSSLGIVWKFYDCNEVPVWRQFTEEGKSLFFMKADDAANCLVTMEEENEALPAAGF